MTISLYESDIQPSEALLIFKLDRTLWIGTYNLSIWYFS